MALSGKRSWAMTLFGKRLLGNGSCITLALLVAPHLIGYHLYNKRVAGKIRAKDNDFRQTNRE